jgi:hypothetical protein
MDEPLIPLWGLMMTRKPSKLKGKKAATSAKKRPTGAARSMTRKPSVYPRINEHMRVTAGQSRRRAIMGLLPNNAVTSAGNTAHFEVSYLTSLGQNGANLAQAILQNCERDYTSLQQIFGNLTPHNLPFVVQVTDDSTGASHSSCLGTDVTVGGNSGGDIDFIRSLLVAEVDEVFMANFGRGWDCGASPGEGLSRVLALDLYKVAWPTGFISSNSWLNQNPRPNFVDTAYPSDTDYVSVGCSVLFLNWLRFQLNHSWADIVAGGGANLAETYNGLTGQNSGWTDFTNFVQAHFPAGQNYNLTTDNPFPV